MARSLPGAALFACDWNAVRSPMAEGIAKTMLGTRVFLQSAGAAGQKPLDHFAVEVCAEIGVDIRGHSGHSFAQLAAWGEDLAQFDLIVALSQAAQDAAQAAAARHGVAVEYWPVVDPSSLGDSRMQRLDAYRRTRDDIRGRIAARFGL